MSNPVFVSRLRLWAAPLCAALLAAGCASEATLKNYVPQIITPYRMDIQQGNFVTQDLVDKLQVGQTREQVKFILGTPLLTDVFHANRWDYIFRSSKGWRDPEKHQLTVFFEDDKLARWEANVPPSKADTPESLAKAQKDEEKPGFFGNLFSRSKPANPPPAPVASATVSPAAPANGAPVAGATNVVSATQESPPPPPAAPPATTIAPAATAGDKPAEQKPGVMNRLFGWMKFSGGSADSSANAARAASPDPEPQPVAKPAPPPPPQAPPAPAPMAPPTATATMTPTEPPAASAAPAAAPASAAPVAAPSSSAPPASAVAAVPAPVVTPPPAPLPKGQAAVVGDILGAIEQWRAAWQARNADAYLAAYAPDFKPGGGLNRVRWEAQRRDRLSTPTFINVKVVDPKVTVGKGDTAVAVFMQEYESDLLKENGRKTLKLGLYGGRWLIRDESVVTTSATAPALAPLVAAPGAPQ